MGSSRRTLSKLERIQWTHSGAVEMWGRHRNYNRPLLDAASVEKTRVLKVRTNSLLLEGCVLLFIMSWPLVLCPCFFSLTGEKRFRTVFCLQARPLQLLKWNALSRYCYRLSRNKCNNVAWSLAQQQTHQPAAAHIVLVCLCQLMQ